DRADYGEVAEGLGRDLSQALARDERLRPVAARQHLRDADHHPPVEDDPERSRDRRNDLALHLAERHQKEGRLELPLRELPHELPGLLLARAVEEGHAVEVDEVDAAPAAHHAPGGYRRVDATREESEDVSTRSHREPTGAGHLLERDEGTPG